MEKNCAARKNNIRLLAEEAIDIESNRRTLVGIRASTNACPPGTVPDAKKDFPINALDTSFRSPTIAQSKTQKNSDELNSISYYAPENLIPGRNHFLLA